MDYKNRFQLLKKWDKIESKTQKWVLNRNNGIYMRTKLKSR